ncbi:MAG: hypothetical protein ACLQVM_09320 [Terriglobia bacterium]
MELGQSLPDRFEAVYYSYAVPRSAEALTILGLVFDRIYFPGVYMPPEGFDEAAVKSEIQRIASLGLQDPDTQQLLGCMAHSLRQKHLTDFCVFSGSNSGLNAIPDEVHEVVDRLEEIIFGPRPQGQIAVRTGPWIKGFPGDAPSTHYLSAPDTITYPANALVFAAKNNLPIVNDQEWLPVPGIPVDPKSSAKLLAIILAMESVRLILPNISPLQPAAFKDFREEIAPDVKPFRLAMLKLAKELNGAISSGISIADVQKEAKFLAETKVYPELANLESVLTNPARHWYKRASDLAKSAPELISNFFTLPTSMALAKVLARVAGVLSDIRDEQRAGEDQVLRSGLNYLLKLRRR